MMKIFGLALGITLIASIAEAGSTTGPQKAKHTILPGDIDSYDIVFRLAEPVLVTIKSHDKSSHVDCFINDQNNKSMAFDHSKNGVCTMRFVPAKTTVFIVKIINSGEGDVSYEMLTN